MLTIVEAWRGGLFAQRHWARNIFAGLVVGVVALPLAMAFAIASGARPEQGIYTAIVAGLVVSTCGGSRLQIAGPTGAFIVILSGITARYGVDGLQLATLMAGGMLLVLGFARLGTIIRFIPDPVIVGFTSGIAVVIWVGQWASFAGLPTPVGAHFHQKLWQLLHALPQCHPATTLLGLGCLLVLVFYLRWVPFIDITGLQTLEEVIRSFRARGVRVLLAGANARVQGKLTRAGVLALVETAASFATLGEALRCAAAGKA